MKKFLALVLAVVILLPNQTVLAGDPPTTSPYGDPPTTQVEM